MNLPFKPHVLALICSAGLLAASGVLYVKSRTPPEPAAVQPAATPAPAPAPAAAPAPTAPTAPEVKSEYTTAQIDQWVAPIALYPDPLLSQVLMASTYPANVVQAVQWSHDNPIQKGDKAIQAVADQPWDPSVKSLVAFPQLIALMGENPDWVQNLGNAFLAQPQDVMDAVQKLRRLAQQTGSLKSGTEQKVSSTPVKRAASVQSGSTSSSVSHVSEPTETIIKIEPANPDVIYIPNYNPTVVYGTWPDTAYPPVYLPPPQGEPFVNSFVQGLGYSMGVATTYALFSNIDWDDDDHHHHDDDHHHHDDDYHHHDGNGYQHNGDNININVNNFNHITGQHLTNQNMTWQHNPAYRNNVPYPNNDMAQHFHQTNVSGGLSATKQPPASLDAQRQAAMTQLQQRTHTSTGNSGSLPAATSRDDARKAASQQLSHITQRSNYRGYDTPQRSTHHTAPQQHTFSQQQRDAARERITSATPQQRDAARERIASATPQQRQQLQQTVRANHANIFSGNDSRSPAWQSQQQRGQQSRRISNLSNEQRSAVREHIAARPELRHR
jgi:Predicted membrane protein